MKKLPHEKLREAAKTEANIHNYYPCVVAAKDFGAMDDTRYTTEVKMLNTIADEIEKYYIPRPRFEDGEPIQFGDSFIQKCVNEEVELDKIGISLFTKDGLNMVWFPDEVVPRPESKVLDADGVEIKIGDTVYFVDGRFDGQPLRVNSIEKFVGLESLDNARRYIQIGCNSGTAKPSLLTHREPDSLEKLLVDLRGAADFIPSKEYLKHLADRLTVIMERDS